MAATGIRVTPEQLQQVSAQLDAGASSIEGTLRQLAGNVAPLGADWAGVAQARFLELWAEWQRSGAALHQALTGIARRGRPLQTRHPLIDLTYQWCGNKSLSSINASTYRESTPT